MRALKQKGSNGARFKWHSGMEGCISLSVAGREGFFVERACTNSPVDTYCACENSSFLFDIDEVMEKKLVDVGEGVGISEPVKVERGLIEGYGIFASLSHQGILAICAVNNASSSVQFTNLNTNRQVEMEVEDDSVPGFYNNKMLLLTSWMPLREVTVEEVFDNPDIETFKEMDETEGVSPYTDVSLLHSRLLGISLSKATTCHLSGLERPSSLPAHPFCMCSSPQPGASSPLCNTSRCFLGPLSAWPLLWRLCIPLTSGMSKPPRPPVQRCRI